MKNKNQKLLDTFTGDERYWPIESDLTPPIREMHSRFKHKRLFIAFPPKRHNSSMALIAKGSETIGRKKLADAQFEDEVKSKTGYLLKIPNEWL